ncbi:MAG: hypothetical protein ACK5HT_05200 [Draconibacterium sp.]
MTKLKKIVLMTSGPGVLLVEAVAVFVQLFTEHNAKPIIVGGLVVFFLIFIPLYSVEYFKQEFQHEKKKSLHFKRKNTRTEWRGGNIHGKVLHEEEKPGHFFKK